MFCERVGDGCEECEALCCFECVGEGAVFCVFVSIFGKEDALLAALVQRLLLDVAVVDAGAQLVSCHSHLHLPARLVLPYRLEHSLRYELLSATAHHAAVGGFSDSVLAHCGQ